MLINENELLLKTSRDNIAAFEIIYDYYKSAIYRFIFRFIKSAELSEDLCQEVFIKIWENRTALPDVKSFKSYLYTVTKNHTLNFLKRASVESNALGIVYSGYTVQRNKVEDDLTTAAYFKHFKYVLNSLPAQSREVFKLCRQQECSYDEAAKLLGISRNTVKKHMIRSMKVLRNSIETELGIKVVILVLIIINF